MSSSPQFQELSVDAFFELVPGSTPTDEERKGFKKIDIRRMDISRVKREEWYSLMTCTANSVLDACNAGKLKFLRFDPHEASDPVTDRQKQPSAMDSNYSGVYWNTAQARDATSLAQQHLERRKMVAEEVDACNEVRGRLSYWAAIPVELKTKLRRTAFHFDDPAQTKGNSSTQCGNPLLSEVVGNQGSEQGGVQRQFIRDSEDGEDALADFAEQVMNVLNHQHRLFCYAIYVWRHMARLCCFDRGAVVVSTEFSWLTTDSPLHDFLWMAARMTPAELGYDPTAELIDDDDTVKPFRNMAENPDVPKAIQDYVRATTAPGVPIHKICITPMSAPPDEGLPDDPSSNSAASPVVSSTAPESSSSSPCLEPQQREFLVGKPHVVTGTLVGRCTRGYVAYDLTEHRLCFIKDYWRPYVPGRSRPEHLIYERLARCRVRNTATLICGGDVGGMRAQTTKLQTLLSHRLDARPVTLVHYRMATKEVGLPLEDFTDFQQLAAILYYAIAAHHQAWTKANILHRDISVGNILIDPYTMQGILIDWDLCLLEWELASGPTKPQHTGTWPFRSALALGYPRKPPRLSDDLEAFIHVFHYLVLKYHPTWTQSLKSFVETTFKGQSRVCGIMVGGQMKLSHFRSPKSPIRVRGNRVLQDVLDALHRGCYESYVQINIPKMRDLYGILDPRMVGEHEELEEVRTPPEDLFSPLLPESSDARPTAPHPSPDYSGKIGAKGDQEITVAAPVGTDKDPVLSEVSDPSDVTGFLSRHADVANIFRETYRGKKVLKDKHVNQFKLRGAEVDQDIFRRPRPSTCSISDMSTSSNTTDVTPSNLYRSPTSADCSVSGSASARVMHSSGKRTRDDQDEDGDAQNAHTPSGDLHTSEGEQPVETRALKKRQKF